MDSEKQEKPSGREIYEASLSGAQNRPYIPASAPTRHPITRLRARSMNSAGRKDMKSVSAACTSSGRGWRIRTRNAFRHS